MNGTWEIAAKSILKKEMKERGLTYRRLVIALECSGVNISENSLRNKLSRGTFSASFFIYCLALMNTTHVRIPEMENFKELNERVKTAFSDHDL